jgi:hypothetical protein
VQTIRANRMTSEPTDMPVLSVCDHDATRKSGVAISDYAFSGVAFAASFFAFSYCYKNDGRFYFYANDYRNYGYSPSYFHATVNISA